MQVGRSVGRSAKAIPDRLKIFTSRASFFSSFDFFFFVYVQGIFFSSPRFRRLWQFPAVVGRSVGWFNFGPVVFSHFLLSLPNIIFAVEIRGGEILRGGKRKSGRPTSQSWHIFPPSSVSHHETNSLRLSSASSILLPRESLSCCCAHFMWKIELPRRSRKKDREVEEAWRRRGKKEIVLLKKTFFSSSCESAKFNSTRLDSRPWLGNVLRHGWRRKRRRDGEFVFSSSPFYLRRCCAEKETTGNFFFALVERTSFEDLHNLRRQTQLSWLHYV